MQIGPIELGERPLFLAPMEDVSDPPFRILCKRYGADMLYTEFISSGGLVHDAENSVMKLDIYDAERPVGIQIFGGDLDPVRQAARIVDAVEPDLIDINFGCPVKKVVTKAAGSALMREPALARRILEATVKAVALPVTLKMRTGWDQTSRNA
ncbi:MAG: tRNA-dihydrouridine synthase family protein, partial [Bacteroidetes bacterium]|nr:tRNA-dihydrouridine synthase family protein [Bacteroidota bacterium]